MYNYDKQLVAELDGILPTYYELFLDSSTPTPCITYIGLSNVAEQEGDTLRYSKLSYRIKIWVKQDFSNLYSYSSLLDAKMFELGFKRRAYNELWIDDLCQLIFTYEATALE